MQAPIYFSSFEDEVHRPWVQRPSPPQPRVPATGIKPFVAPAQPALRGRSYADKHKLALQARAESQRKMDRALAISQRAHMRQQMALTAQQQAMAPFNQPRQRSFASAGGMFQPGPAGVGVRLVEPVAAAAQPLYYAPPVPVRTPLIMSEPAIEGVTYDIVVNGPAVLDALPWQHSGAPLAAFAAQVVMDAVANGIAYLAELRGCFDRSPAAASQQYLDLTGLHFGEQSAFTAHPSLAARSYQLASTPPRWGELHSSTVAFVNTDGSLNARTFADLDEAKRYWSTPTAAFVSYVQSLLSESLVAPEDVLLALHYIHRIPDSHLIFPSESGCEEGGAVCTAPFKLFTGALMLANKTNQDNPYRNETWAQLAKSDKQTTFKIEMDIVKALKYESAVRSKEVWRDWCARMTVRAKSLALDLGAVTLLDRIHRASLLDPAEQANPSPKIVYAARPGQDHSIVAGFRRAESEPNPTFDPVAFDQMLVARGQPDIHPQPVQAIVHDLPCYAPGPSSWFQQQFQAQQMVY